MHEWAISSLCYTFRLIRNVRVWLGWNRYGVNKNTFKLQEVPQNTHTLCFVNMSGKDVKEICPLIHSKNIQFLHQNLKVIRKLIIFMFLIKLTLHFQIKFSKTLDGMKIESKLNLNFLITFRF